jgi:hypothetical protein
MALSISLRILEELVKKKVLKREEAVELLDNLALAKGAKANFTIAPKNGKLMRS